MEQSINDIMSQFKKIENTSSFHENSGMLTENNTKDFTILSLFSNFSYKSWLKVLMFLFILLLWSVITVSIFRPRILFTEENKIKWNSFLFVSLILFLSLIIVSFSSFLLIQKFM